MFKVRGKLKLQKHEKKQIIKELINDPKADTSELEEEIESTDSWLMTNAMNYIENEVANVETPEEMLKKVKHLSNGVEHYINGDKLESYFELAGSYQQEKIIEMLKKVIIARLKKYQSNLDPSKQSEEIEDINYAIDEIVFNLNDNFFLQVIKDRYEENVNGCIFNLLAYFIQNYKPMSETLYQIDEYARKVGLLENKYSNNKQLSFNVKLRNSYPDIDIIKDILLEKGKIKEEDYETITSFDIFDSPESPWSLFNIEKWEEVKKYLTEKYDRVQSVESEGKNGGWMIVKYPILEEDRLKIIENNLKDGRFEIGDEIHYSELFDLKINLDAECFWSLTKEINDIEEYINSQVENYRSDFLTWLEEKY